MKKTIFVLIFLVFSCLAKSQSIPEYKDLIEFNEIELFNLTNRTKNSLIIYTPMRYFEFNDSVSSLVIEGEFSVMLYLDNFTEDSIKIFKTKNKKHIKIDDYVNGYIDYIALPHRECIHVFMEPYEESFYIYKFE